MGITSCCLLKKQQQFNIEFHCVVKTIGTDPGGEEVKAASLKITKTLIRKESLQHLFPPLTSQKGPYFILIRVAASLFHSEVEGTEVMLLSAFYDLLISYIRQIRPTRTVAPGAADY